MSPKTKTGGMHRTQLFLPQDLYESLMQEAEYTGITNSELVRQIISKHLSHSHRSQTESGMATLLEMGEKQA